MDEIYKELQNTSVAVYNEKNKQKLELSRQADERLECAINNLTTQILDGAIETMRLASSQGQFSCVLFECSGRDQYNDEFRTSYVIRGPVRWTGASTFFEKKGILSVVQRLSRQLDPIHVYLRYDRLTSNTLVCASWKTT